MDSSTRRLTTPVRDPSAWRSTDFPSDLSWVWHLPDAAIPEIDAALERIRARGTPLTGIQRADFPVPAIAADLAGIQDQLENGRGFAVIRGLPFEHYDDDDIARIFWGIGTHLGRAISQNAQGDLLGHVKDVGGLEYLATNVRGYQTAAELLFHNDNCDYVGLLCFRKAKSGGVSRFTSATTVYNEILATHPEYLDLLYRGFHYDLRGEERDGYAPITPHRIPVYSWYEGKLSCRYVYSSIMQAARKSGIPLAPEETAALDCMNALAAREDFCIEMMLEPGDMQFLCNHVCLHSRTAFVDHEEPDRKRHLLRLWLNNPDGRTLAPEFADRYGSGVGMGVLPKDRATTEAHR